MSILNDQIVGQSLMLECFVSAVRGITSRVDIVWSSNGVEINIVKGINISSVANNSLLFTERYIIPKLSTVNENRKYKCEVIINVESPVTVSDSVILNVTGKYISYIYFLHSSNTELFLLIVPYINITVIPSGPIQGAMVGSPQDIQCIVSTVSGVELSSVMISWMGPGGESITNDSRVTISPTTSSGNNYTSSLQFTYLMEGDEGIYTCNVMILETTAIDVVEMINLNGKEDYTKHIASYEVLYINCLCK